MTLSIESIMVAIEKTNEMNVNAVEGQYSQEENLFSECFAGRFSRGPIITPPWVHQICTSACVFDLRDMRSPRVSSTARIETLAERRFGGETTILRPSCRLELLEKHRKLT
jgi:hypothetical protein